MRKTIASQFVLHHEPELTAVSETKTPKPKPKDRRATKTKTPFENEAGPF